MLDALQKGDEVIAMGIIGRIAKIGDGYIGLEVADGKIIHIQRQAVTTLLPKGTFNDVTKQQFSGYSSLIVFIADRFH